MRYIGSKASLLETLDNQMTAWHIPNNGSNLTFLDLFAGTNSVARYFKNRYKVITNDSMYFSYVLSKGHVIPNTQPSFEKLYSEIQENPLVFLNRLTNNPQADNFIAKNYSPFDSDRQYFTVENALKIDVIRSQISVWHQSGLINELEYFYLLAGLVAAVPFVSNISGVYGAYLKTWDKRSFLNLTLLATELFDNNKENIAYNQDANELIGDIVADICYIDPPYNTRHYTSNYHLLETIALNDKPNIYGKTGLREFSQERKSSYCQKSGAESAIEHLIQNIQANHIVMSYSSDGIVPKTRLIEMFGEYGISNTVRYAEIPYRKYKSKKFSDKPVIEYLLYVQK